MRYSTSISASISEDDKEKAKRILAACGISMSEYIRMAVSELNAQQDLPFAKRVPNKQTVEALRAADRGEVRTTKSLSELLKG